VHITIGDAMQTRYNISEVYPNSPLVEVVCEIRFPADLAIECKRDEFYNRIKKTYPTIWLSKNENSAIPSLTPFRFDNATQTAGILMGIDRFAFFEKHYKGHKTFTKEFVSLSKSLKETYALKNIQRLGWRYINVIPFTREDGILPLHRFINLDIKLPDCIPDQFENFNFVFMSKVSGGTITSRIESIIRAEDQQEALLMDFDFAMNDKIVFSKLNSHVNKAHEQTRIIFENLITDEYRQYLRGETI
jgi:uncharacterized protein (TIGR04255 family)